MPQSTEKVKQSVLMAGKMKDALGYKTPSVGKHKTHKEVIKSLELLEHYMNMREEWATKFREAEQFRNGIQWTTTQVTELQKRGQTPIVVNRIHPAIETAKAMLTSRKPEFRATGRDDSDRKVADVFSSLFQWIWDMSQANVELKRALDDYYVGGMGVLQVYQDPHADMGNGECVLKSIYPLDVYIDPNARDTFCRDAASIIVARLMTDEEAKAQYPEYARTIENAEISDHVRYPRTDLEAIENQIMTGDLDTQDNSHHKKREYIERYSRIKENVYKIYDTTTKYQALYDNKEYEKYTQEPAVVLIPTQGEPQYVTDLDEVEAYIELADVGGGYFHMAPDPMTGQPIMKPGMEDLSGIPDSTIEVDIIRKADLIGDDIIMTNKIVRNRVQVVASVGSKLMYIRKLPTEDYPIVTMMNVHNRNPFPESDVRIYRPLQEYINKIRSLIVAHASTSTNVKLLIPRGSVNKKEVEQEWGRSGTAVIEFDGELGAPVVAGPIPLPNELYKNEAEAKHDLEYGFGIFELMQGGGTPPSTYRGTVAIDEYGQRRIKSRQDDLESVLNQLAKVTIPLMQQIYTEEKVIRLVQPSGLIKETKFNYQNEDLSYKINDITTGMYDIIVVSGSTLPSNRWAQFEYYMQMFQAGLIDQVEMLKKTEVVDTEGVLERMNTIKMLQQQLQQQDEEIKELKGDLQTADRETVGARKRLEVEKFKSELSDQSSKAKAATSLYDARLKDTIANVKQSVKPQKGDQNE
jgi:hypothetical protein|tara:strand:- start:1797 stop:4043 length:2247 start_codon:yes stop_codon:yes gene_type:complete